MTMAVTANPIVPEAKSSPVTGPIPVEGTKVINPELQSTQLSHLAKKESKMMADREAYKKEREAFLKEQEEFKSVKVRVEDVYKKAMAFEETRKKDPIKALSDLGFTEKEIVDYLSREEETAKISPEDLAKKAAQDEIQKYKDEQTKKADEAQKANDTTQIQKFRGQLTSQITANPEKYELCAHHGAVAEEIMFGIALEEAKEGKTPNIESIANEVEEFYLKEYESMSKLKKLTPKQEAVLQAKQPERSRVVQPPEALQKPKVTTLTNRIAPTAAAAAKAVSVPETREQKRARIEQLIRNGLTRH